jgi:hypothetical protein
MRYWGIRFPRELILYHDKCIDIPVRAKSSLPMNMHDSNVHAKN